MFLVTILESHEDVDCVGERRLVNLDRLEPPLQCRVLLEVLPVFLECGGTDRLELAPRQHGLENRGSVDGAFGCAGSNQSVDLVDEENDVAPALDLFQDLLEPLLEVTSIAGAGHKGTEIEGV